jgi:hypothetical protein
VVLNNCKHQPGPKTHIDKYIDMAKCIDCGLSLYYLTSAFESLMLPGKNRVMQRIEELQRVSNPDSNIPEGKQDGRVGRISRNKEIAAVVPKIIDGHSAGKSIRQLAKENEISKNTVRSIIINPAFPLPTNKEAKVKMMTGNDVTSNVTKEVANAVSNLPETLLGQTQELPPVPEKPEGNLQAIGRYYKQNAEQIIRELKQLGAQAVYERWEFSPSSWNRFRDLHNLPFKYRRVKRGEPSNKTPIKGKHNYPKNRKSAVKDSVKNKQDSDIHGTWVSFPPFNDKWPAETQVKWLEVYKELAQHGNLKGKPSSD